MFINHVRLYSGLNSIKKLDKIISSQNLDSVLVVCGKSSYELSGAKNYFSTMDNSEKFFFFSDYSSTPSIEEVREGIKVFKETNPAMIVAIGGGSTIDAAKGIIAFSNIKSNFEKLVIKNKPLLVAIPTTLGTGSEVTSFAAIYKDGKKFSVEHRLLKPDIAILDPILLRNLPKYIRISSGLDAFSQAIESYWSRASTKESRKASSKAIKYFVSNFVESVSFPSSDLDIGMQQAVCQIGNAIDQAKTTAPHALSYYLTSRTGIAHGHAVALTLGKFFEINYFLSREQKNYNYQKREKELLAMLNCDNPTQARIYWEELLKNFKIEYHLINYINQNEIKMTELVENVNIIRLKNHPVRLSKEDLLEYLKD